MKTVHMVGNAHLDPVWLWRPEDGLDAVLATARSACDRLDEYRQFVFTCSGSWFHRQVAEHDPDLFARVRRFVEEGRWQIVGGMVIQPDCNLPAPESFARQLRVGQEYCRRTFGRTTTVGYNMDSFGHTGYLPRFLRRGGLDGYVFMRPGLHEKQLPANLFRWRSPDGHEVLACRIIGSYCPAQADLRTHIQATLAQAPAQVDHALCFYGVGDHGGGPTRAQIEWILANCGAIPGARLMFSHPRAFFDAVKDRAGALPVVTGELQHHAIGCYSVERRIKVAMRRAEARLLQAEQTIEAFAEHASPDAQQSLDAAWQAVLFNQFHDILGGTCLEHASRVAAAEFAAAQARAEEVITRATRRAFRGRASPGRHRIVIFNPADEPFDGYLEHEPWLGGSGPGRPVLVDEDARPVAHQWVEPEAKVRWLSRLLFRLAVPAGSWRILGLEPGAWARATGAGPEIPDVGLGGMENASAPGAPVRLREATGADDGAVRVGGWSVALEVYDDPSDTWSHSCGSRFDGARAGGFAWQGGWEAVEGGPLRAAVRRLARFDCSRLWCRLAATVDEPMLHLRLSVVWAQARQRLVLRVAAPAAIDRRTDLVSGGPLDRALDGEEYPLTGGMVLDAGDARLAIVAPEVFSVSADARGAMLTLLRSPYAAHHDPMPGEIRPDHPVTDQGTHEFEVLLCPGMDDAPAVEKMARRMLAPPIIWDLMG